MRKLLPLLAAACAGAAGHAHPADRTYINPLDLDYRYNFEQVNEGVSYRTGADPAIVNHKGAYYLFMTLADGYWRSTDLIRWDFVTPSRWPFQSIVAPAVWSDGDRIVLQPSMMEPGSILQTDAPETGRLDFLVRRMPPMPNSVEKGADKMKPGEVPPGPWDPALFKDDDGQWYLYWGSSNVFPMYGQKIAFEDGKLVYQTPPVPMLGLDPAAHGWERFGQDHCACWAPGKPSPSYMEGAWMTKVGKTYYLQYGAPGTEFNVYANGVYTSDRPLGPFRYAPYNPVAYRPGGFAVGAGHGSTFRDRYGNWWNSGTSWIGYNWGMERRIVLYPAVFEADGQMRVSTRFGDFPHYAPTAKVTDPESLFAGWMLLSYRKAASASSTLGTFAAANVTDEDPRSFWVAAHNRSGETITVDLGAVDTVRAVQVNFADYKSGRFGDSADVYTRFSLESSTDGRTWRPIAATGREHRDRPNAYFELPAPVAARFVRYVHGHVGAATLAIGDIRVFGKAAVPPPRIPAALEVSRDCDPRNAAVRWRAVKGAVGYNVRWGIRPDRLGLTYQVFADRAGAPTASLALRSLNVGQPYFVAVEAFGEGGVSPLTRIAALPATCRGGSGIALNPHGS